MAGPQAAAGIEVTYRSFCLSSSAALLAQAAGEAGAAAAEPASGSLEQLAATMEGHAEEVVLINQALEDKADALALQDTQVIQHA